MQHLKAAYYNYCIIYLLFQQLLCVLILKQKKGKRKPVTVTGKEKCEKSSAEEAEKTR